MEPRSSISRDLACNYRFCEYLAKGLSLAFEQAAATPLSLLEDFTF